MARGRGRGGWYRGRGRGGWSGRGGTKKPSFQRQFIKVVNPGDNARKGTRVYLQMHSLTHFSVNYIKTCSTLNNIVRNIRKSELVTKEGSVALLSIMMLCIWCYWCCICFDLYSLLWMFCAVFILVLC